ncbi:MAG: hypothetical protein ACR5K9_07740 [Wolbachia sp.]
MGYVINLLNFPIIAKKSSFSFVPLPMKLGMIIIILTSRHHRFKAQFNEFEKVYVFHISLLLSK